MFAVSFNLYNGNDFDSDDYSPAEKGWVSDFSLSFHSFCFLALIVKHAEPADVCLSY